MYYEISKLIYLILINTESLYFRSIGNAAERVTENCRFVKKLCLFEFLYRELKQHKYFSIRICKKANKLEATVNCQFE